MSSGKQNPNKSLLVLGLIFIVIWPLLILFYRPILSVVPSALLDAPGVVIPGTYIELSALFISFIVLPPVIGSILILQAVLKKK